MCSSDLTGDVCCNIYRQNLLVASDSGDNSWDEQYINEKAWEKRLGNAMSTGFLKALNIFLEIQKAAHA